MRALKGLILLIPGILTMGLELYFLIIEPIQKDLDLGIPERQYWAIVLPVFFITMLIAFIMGWVGYTMMITKEPIRMTYDSAYEEAAGKVDKKVESES